MRRLNIPEPLVKRLQSSFPFLGGFIMAFSDGASNTLNQVRTDLGTVSKGTA